MSNTCLHLQIENDATRFADLGVAKFSSILNANDVAALDAMFPTLPPRTAGARSEAFTSGARAFLGSQSSLTALASNLLGFSNANLSRIQVFNKSEGANWFVPWHQDRAEDGADRPVSTLEQTVALRIHLDDCNEDCGPLEVLPGSHLNGRLDAKAIKQKLASTRPWLCLAERGEIVAMRPLLVHRSKRATRPTARRVIHLEYSG
ncbi:MAG: phytanoyl-CoA dioxygenase family protein [Alphaproteobacteria bacterium]|nr:phytanoyl-CoA dioxygenase family protein [Alphaproteobacteria bacterium]